MAYRQDHSLQKALPRTPIGRLPPRLPPLPTSQYQSLRYDHTNSPSSPLVDSTTPLYQTKFSPNDLGDFHERDDGSRQQPRTRQYSETMPLAGYAQPMAGGKEEASIALEPVFEPPRPIRRRTKERAKKPFISWDTTWVVYILSLIQASVFIAELVKNGMFNLL